MSKKRALIFGINGQDGSNLTDYLLSQDIEVYGMVRRHSFSETQSIRINHVSDKVITEYGDMTDEHSIRRMFEIADKPYYVFNLAAMSHVALSFKLPDFTMNVNFLGHQKVLRIFKELSPESRLYFAASSEMFGLSVDPDGYQRESCNFSPTSPYGISKLAAFKLTDHYRRAYNLFCCSGVLFNHSGLRRGINFVEQKIARSAAMIKLGLMNTLELGNMDSYRDYGMSTEYVKAMKLILDHKEPDNFVVATGVTTSVRQICEMAFSHVGLNYADHIKQNPKFMRDEELPYLRGDSTKAQMTLGWRPEYTVERMINEMVDYWLEKLK